MTHADPRCLASCVAVTTAVRFFHSVDLGSMIMNCVPGTVSTLLFHVAQIALMLQGTHDPGKKKERENLVNEAIAVSDITHKSLQYFMVSWVH